MSNPEPPLLAALDIYHWGPNPQVNHQSARPAAPPRAHGTVRRLSGPELEALVAGYQSGATVYALATEFGIHRHTVSSLLKQAGLQLRRRPMTTAEIARAAELYATGKSLVQVGALLGFDHGTIHRALRRLGVRMRDVHGRS